VRSTPPAASPITRVVAVLLLLGATLVGLARLPGELSRQADAAAVGRDLPRIQSVPVLPALGERPTEFLAYVRRRVPPDEPVRIVQAVRPPPPLSHLEPPPGGPPGVCGNSVSRPQYFWVVYTLAPRPSTCDPDARWTVYFGVPPGVVPAGARPFAAGYALVRR